MSASRKNSIAFIGNMNNNFYSIVRHLRDRGIDAQLLRLDKELPHFHPKCDSRDEEYSDFTRFLKWGDKSSLRSVPARQIKSDLESYGRLVGCGLAPAFAEKAGLRLDMFIPYGDDVYDLPFFPLRSFVKFPRQLLKGTVLRRLFKAKVWKLQRRGIRNTRWVQQSNATHNPSQGRIKRLSIDDKIFYAPIPMVYDYFSSVSDWDPIWTNELLERVRQIREESDFLIMHHNRHSWTVGSDPYARKGNDVFLRGFAEFCKETHGTSTPRALLLEYGSDVAASKRLIQELQIENRVVWLPKAERRLIYLVLSLVDVGIGQFHYGGYLNGVTQEILGVGKPLIHHCRSDYVARTGQALYPYLEAQTPEEVAKALTELWRHPKKRQCLGDTARDWYRENVIERAMHEYSKHLQLPMNTIAKTVASQSQDDLSWGSAETQGVA